MLLTCVPSFFRGEAFLFIGFGMKFLNIVGDLILGNYARFLTGESLLKAINSEGFLNAFMYFFSSCVTFSLIVLFFITFFHAKRNLYIRRSKTHPTLLLLISFYFVFSGGFGDFINASVIQWKIEFLARLFGQYFLHFESVLNFTFALFLYLMLDKIYSWLMFFFES